MEAKDLRIGNYVSCPEMDSIDIVSIGHLSVIENGGGYIYEPIPLTKEWLIKLGFEKHYHLDDQPEQGYYFTLEFFNNTYEDLCLISNEDLCLISNEDFTVELFPFSQRYNYVHEVQNLYHAITGKELTIK